MRDKNGRFTKDDNFKITLYIPKFTKIIYWILMLFVLMPWITLIIRLDILKKILSLFEKLWIKTEEEEKEAPRKNCLFS